MQCLFSMMQHVTPPYSTQFELPPCHCIQSSVGMHSYFAFWTTHLVVVACYRPLSRRLDRCDRMIQNESKVPSGGNVNLFSAATCTSQCKLRSLRANARLLYRNVSCIVTDTSPLKTNTHYRLWLASLTIDGNGIFAIKAYNAWRLRDWTADCILCVLHSLFPPSS